MSVAHQVETLIYRSDESAEGLVALGDMLGWAPNDAQKGTLAGLGIVLRQLGENIRAANKEVIDTSFHKITALENAKNGVIDLRSAQQVPEAPRSPREEACVTRLRAILEDSLTKK
jgi:hypothetical protein